MIYIVQMLKEVKKNAETASVETIDLINFGMIPEFIGRFPVIRSTTELTIEQLMQILTEPENALLKQYKFHFALHGIDLQFTEEAIRDIAREAFERKCGARGLRSIVENVLSDALFELPDINEEEEQEQGSRNNNCSSDDKNRGVIHTAVVDLECVAKKGQIKYIKHEQQRNDEEEKDSSRGSREGATP